MPYKCSALHCNTGYPGSVGPPQITLHKFPLNNPTLLEKWLRNLNRENFVPTEHSRVCSLHFAQEDFNLVSTDSNTWRRQRKNTAIVMRRLKLDACPFSSEMVAECVAPGCLSGHQNQVTCESVTFHKFPLDDLSLLDRWLRRLNLLDFDPTENSRLCSLHFRKSDFLTSNTDPHQSRVLDKDQILIRKRLKPNAVPKLPSRDDSDAVSSGEEQIVEMDYEFDKVDSLAGLEAKLNATVLPEGFVEVRNRNEITFTFANSSSDFLGSISVNSKMKVCLTFHGQTVPRHKYREIAKWKVFRFSQIQKLMELMKSWHSELPGTQSLRQTTIGCMEKLIATEGNELQRQRYQFLMEQLKLANVAPTGRRFSNETMLFAFKVFVTSSQAYQELYSQDRLILPSLMSLRRISYRLRNSETTGELMTDKWRCGVASCDSSAHSYEYQRARNSRCSFHAATRADCGCLPFQLYPFPQKQPYKDAWTQLAGMLPGSVTGVTRICSRHFVDGQTLPTENLPISALRRCRLLLRYRNQGIYLPPDTEPDLEELQAQLLEEDGINKDRVEDDQKELDDEFRTILEDAEEEMRDPDVAGESSHGAVPVPPEKEIASLKQRVRQLLVRNAELQFNTDKDKVKRKGRSRVTAADAEQVAEQRRAIQTLAADAPDDEDEEEEIEVDDEPPPKKNKTETLAEVEKEELVWGSVPRRTGRFGLGVPKKKKGFCDEASREQAIGDVLRTVRQRRDDEEERRFMRQSLRPPSRLRRQTTLTTEEVSGYPLPSLSGRFRCQAQDCVQRFEQLQDLDSHMRFKHSTAVLRCSLCLARFQSLIVLVEHQEMGHALEDQSGDHPTYVCEENTQQESAPGEVVVVEYTESLEESEQQTL